MKIYGTVFHPIFLSSVHVRYAYFTTSVAHYLVLCTIKRENSGKPTQYVAIISVRKQPTALSLQKYSRPKNVMLHEEKYREIS